MGVQGQSARRGLSLPAQRLPRERRTRQAIVLLQSLHTDGTAHAHGRSLLEHLVGTAQLLLAWNAPLDHVLAGLCHSVYGTQAFRKISLAHAQRPRLQQLIGRRAEALVWLFSTLRRPACLLKASAGGHCLVRTRAGRSRHLDPDTLGALFVIECANLLDQGVSLALARRLLKLARRHAVTPPAMLQALQKEMRLALYARSRIHISSH
ncbi:DUF6817 domain-containing protein [Uliginosibacterium sediminicola]|uniref:DUF6817 domain-containing protein n=1 Tax=Uliginosibacterium sediminicola TaxID=2024550 RepID=A0ABU9YTF8_9RHOO